MPTSGLRDVPKKAVNHPRRKRRERLMQIVRGISYVVAGILLCAAWHRFRTFEGLPGALGQIPHDHPMHRGIEAAVFLAVAAVPLAVCLILRLRLRRIPRRTTR